MLRAAAVVVASCTALAACERVPVPGGAEAVFRNGSDVGELRGADMREASGLVASLRHPGHFWLHNDSGNEPELNLLDSSGAAVMRLRIEGVRNRDWEDLGRRGDTLFIAEMGDNQAEWDTVYVHAVVEPAVIAESATATPRTFPFRYPDGPRDAETLLVDPETGDWFIVTKREERSLLYRYPAAQRAPQVVTLERLPTTFGFRMAVGGDVSPDGREVLVKTYDAIYLWQRRAGESLAATLSRAPSPQPYTPERQGEAIAFALDGSAYFTTSEVELDVPQLLLRYERRTPQR